VAASWESRRERIRREGGLIGPHLPAWVERVNGRPRLIAERAAAVKRIFQLAAAGLGHTRIVRALIDEGVPAFGLVRVREGRSRSQFSGRWARPYVANILNDRRAMGDFQPRKLDGTPAGAPLAGYLPAAVMEEEFLLARAAQGERLGRDKSGRPVVARESKHVNVFRGLLRHARDGDGMVLLNKGTAAAPKLVLISAAGRTGRGRCWTFSFSVFEEAILTLLREVDPADVLPTRPDPASRADVLRAKLAAVREDLAGLKADLGQQYSKTLVVLVREKEALEEAVGRELQEELAKAVRPTERAWEELPSLAALVNAGGDEARLKLRPVLRRVIETIDVLIVTKGVHRLCAAQVTFKDSDKRRSYLISHRTAGNRRPGRWSARSFADVGGGDLDLRKPAHAKRLEKFFAGLDPAELE
jgi:hypothetical protein